LLLEAVVQDHKNNHKTKNTLETGGEVNKTPLETSGEDGIITLKTSVIYENFENDAAEVGQITEEGLKLVQGNLLHSFRVYFQIFSTRFECSYHIFPTRFECIF
jgi:hypothetical protein